MFQNTNYSVELDAKAMKAQVALSLQIGFMGII